MWWVEPSTTTEGSLRLREVPEIRELGSAPDVVPDDF
jgi:hypothetical protein